MIIYVDKKRCFEQKRAENTYFSSEVLWEYSPMIIAAVFYTRRHFALNQFYPNHVKLSSKEQMGNPLEQQSRQTSQGPENKGNQNIDLIA